MREQDFHFCSLIVLETVSKAVLLLDEAMGVLFFVVKRIVLAYDSSNLQTQVD